MNLEQMIAALKDSIMEMKSANDKRLTEIETKGAASATSIAAVEKANGKIGDLQTKISELETEIKANKTAMARLGMGADGKVETKEAKALLEVKSSFDRFIRGKATAEDVTRMTEYKAAQQITDNTLGGYLVTPEYGQLFVAKREELSPLRQYAKVDTITATELKLPNVESSDVEAEWEDEASDAADGTQAFKAGMLTVRTHALRVLPYITFDLLADASYDVMGELNRFSAIKMAQKETQAFHTGDGVGKPRGFLTYGAEIEVTNTGEAAALAADAFHTVEGTMKTAYKAGAAYFMNRKTMALVRLLKDANDRYLMEYNLANKGQSTINGFPVIEDPDMPDVAAGSTPIAFANFADGYQIVDNAAKTFEMLPRGFLNKPDIAFWYNRTRVGGAARIKEAIKLIKVAVNA